MVCFSPPVRSVLEKGLCRSGPPATLPISDMERGLGPLFVRRASSLAPSDIPQTKPRAILPGISTVSCPLRSGISTT